MKSAIIILVPLLVLGLFVLAGSQAAAQGVTTAAINGMITGKGGEALPAVNIVAVHQPSGTQFGTSTRDDGHYNLQGLRVGGPYTVTASLIGYQPHKRVDINLQLSQNLRLDFVLTEEAVEVAAVEVIGERNAVMSASRTGAATSVSRDQIDLVPTVSRSFQDAYRLSPLFVGNNAAGRNNRFNNIQIDGAVYNDLFGLASSGTPGGQANINPISLDALQEFQIVIAPYDVRQSGFTGAGINAITRSGTNRFAGSAYYYGRNQDFAGKSPDTLRTKLANFSDYRIGFRVGGPIIENQLFFFTNAELYRRSSPLTRVFGAASTGTNQYTTPIDSVQRFANALRGYGYDPGSFTDITNERQGNNIFGRLDYNLSEVHRITLRHNYNDGGDDNSPSGSGIYSSNLRYKFNDVTNSTVLQISSAFSSTIANEFILGYTTIRDKRDIYGNPFPEVLIRSAGLGGGGDLRAGAETFSNANALDQNVFEITDNFTYFLGNHTFTVGTQNQFFKFSNLFIRNIYGNYEFATLTDFINKKPARYQLTYSLLGDPKPRAEFRGIQYGLYAQDEWTVMPGLKLNLGVRADIPTFPDKPLYNPSIDTLFGARGLQTNKVPSGLLLLSPRIGFNYDPTGDRTWQVRGGVGTFSGRIGYVWLSNQYGNTGVDFARFDVSNLPANFVFQPDPYKQTAAGLSPVTTTEVDLTDPDFKMPQVFRVNLGVDRQLPFGFVGTIEGLYTSTVNDILYQDINLAGTQSSALTPGGTLVGDGRPVYGTYSTSTRRFTAAKVSNKFTNVILMKNTSDGYAYNITAQLQRAQAADGWYGNLAYTFGLSKDHNSIASSQAISQWRFNQVPGDPNNPPLSYSQYDTRHRIIAAASYSFEVASGFRTTVSLFYEGRSGQPLSFIYNGDVNGDGQTSNDLIYIPKDRNDVVLMSGTAASATVLPTSDVAYTNLDKYIQNDGYLSSHRGAIAERMGGRTSWSHSVDFKLAQEVPVIAEHRIEITFDVLNILNLLNRDWGYVPFISNNQDFVLTFHSLDPVSGKPRYVWQKTDPNVPAWVNDNLLSRWGAQIGLRYSF